MKNRMIGIVALMALGSPGMSNATFVFTDVSITPGSVTFTINGNMDGYLAPPTNYLDTFSLVYYGNLWAAPQVFSANTWSHSVFDNETFFLTGSTGGFGLPNNYSWSAYATSLSDAFASNRTIQLDLGGTYLDPLANGHLDFVWGLGDIPQNHVVLASVTTGSTEVPEPTGFALFCLGMVSLGLVRRMRKAQGWTGC